MTSRRPIITEEPIGTPRVPRVQMLRNEIRAGQNPVRKVH
jgi:hypothetical protein